MVSETLQDVNIKVGAKGHSHCKTPSKQKFPVVSELQFHHHILKLSQNPADKVTGDLAEVSLRSWNNMKAAGFCKSRDKGKMRQRGETRTREKASGGEGRRSGDPSERLEEVHGEN